MHQGLCHVAKKDGKPVEGNAKCETHTTNAPFGWKTDFHFEASLVEETIPSNNTVWNPWIGNGNSGMDEVSLAKGIDETQLSKNHSKQPRK